MNIAQEIRQRFDHFETKNNRKPQHVYLGKRSIAKLKDLIKATRPLEYHIDKYDRVIFRAVVIMLAPGNDSDTITIS